MGKGDLSIQIAEYFHQSSEWELCAVIPDSPEPDWTSSLSKWADKHGIPLIQDLEEISNTKFDLGFSCYFGKILREKHLEVFSLALNLHNGPLPKYRGVNPVNWALKNKETFHGVTIHRIDLGVDSGDIFGQVLFDIDSEIEEVIDVYKRCLKYGYTLFTDVISKINKINPRQQDESQVIAYTRKDFEKLGERKGFTRLES